MATIGNFDKTVTVDAYIVLDIVRDYGTDRPKNVSVLEAYEDAGEISLDSDQVVVKVELTLPVSFLDSPYPVAKVTMPTAGTIGAVAHGTGVDPTQDRFSSWDE